MKILIVDNSATMRKIIDKNLRNNGFEDLEEASNGAEALEKMQGIDLVITDWTMPIMDGLTLVKRIREDPVYAEVPIIMISTEGAQKEVLEALKAGVNDYIVKPFTPAILVEKLKAVIDGQ